MSEIKYTVLSIAEGKARCDSAMKALLSNIHILSRLLKELVPEYKGYSISDIEEKYIEKRSITISSSGVADHFPEVSVMSNEDLGFSEAGKVYFYRFQKKCINVIINEDKASSEASEIVCSDLSESGDHKSHKRAGLDHLSKDISGLQEQTGHYDLISVIMVSLNERTKVSSSILELIRILGSNKASKLDKLQALRNNDIIVDDNIEKEVGYMCNWGEYMWQGGLKEGLEQGINQGEEKLNSLYVFLMNDGKLEEMKRVMHDKAYRQELYKVYGL